MTRTVVASAPGKVILFGEHFVVKGSRAIATSIGLRVKVRVEECGAWPIKIKSLDLGVEGRVDSELNYWGSHHLKPFTRILQVLNGMGYKIQPARVTIVSEIPIAAGLGSSAASAASFALAYSTFLGSALSEDDLVKVAYEAEVIVHGRPSGIDNNIVVYGGGLVYRRGETPERINVTLPEGYVVLIANTGIERSTGVVVRDVLRLAESTWNVTSKIYEAADSIIDEALNAFARGDMDILGKLMNINQGLLNAVGASSMEIESLIFAARSAGAKGAKLTGAGRGGSVIILVERERLDDVRKAIKDKAVWIGVTSLGVEGVILES